MWVKTFRRRKKQFTSKGFSYLDKSERVNGRSSKSSGKTTNSKSRWLRNEICYAGINMSPAPRALSDVVFSFKFNVCFHCFEGLNHQVQVFHMQILQGKYLDDHTRVYTAKNV